MTPKLDKLFGGLLLMLLALASVGVYHLLLRPVDVTECRVRAEYALTGADTAALVKRIPFCAEVLYRD